MVPHGLTTRRGNAVSSARLAALLARRGVAVDLLDLERPHSDLPRPDLVHGIHLRKSGPVASALARSFGVPLVLSARGTEAAADAGAPFVAGARVLVALTEAQRDELAAAFPRERIVVVPQGVAVPPLDRRPEADLVVQVSGLRRAKGLLEALRALDAVAAARPAFRYVVAGPEIEEAYARAFRAALATRPWATWAGEVDAGGVADLHARASLALNTSLREGMSNAVLEACAAACPVVASDIPGNRAVIEDGVTGLVYGDLAACVLRLLRDPALAERLGLAARRRVEREFSPEREAEGHLAAYARAMG